MVNTYVETCSNYENSENNLIMPTLLFQTRYFASDQTKVMHASRIYRHYHRRRDDICVIKITKSNYYINLRRNSV